MTRIVEYVGGKKVVRDASPSDLPPGQAAELALQIERDAMICTRLQARAALLAAGKLDSVDALVANSGILTQEAWANAIEFTRYSQTLVALGTALGLTGEEIDDLFRAAMAIQL